MHDSEQAERYWRADPGNDLLEMIADALPDGHGIQLLRSLGAPALKHGGVKSGWYMQDDQGNWSKKP